MNWLWACLAAVLGAVLGGAGGVALGLGCVRWYHVSSFEGKSGFVVAGVMLAGVVGGMVVSFAAAWIASGGQSAPLRQLLGGAGAVAGALLLSALVAYLNAGTAR